MHHHIGNAARSLVGGKGIGQLGVHHRKDRAKQLRSAQAQFMQTIQFRNHCVSRAFTSCCRDGEYHTYLQGLCNFGFSDVEIPKITIIGNSGGNGFCRVYNGASPYGKHKVHSLATCQFDALIHFRISGIGLHASQLYVFHTGGFQGILHALQQTAAYN